MFKRNAIFLFVCNGVADKGFMLLYKRRSIRSAAIACGGTLLMVTRTAPVYKRAPYPPRTNQK